LKKIMQMLPARALVQGWMVLAALMACTPASAQTDGQQSSYASAYEYHGLGGMEDWRFRNGADFLGATSTAASYSGPDGSATVSAGSSIGPGTIHANVAVAYQGSYISASASVEAYMFDSLRFSGEGLGYYDRIDVTYSVLVSSHTTFEQAGGGYFSPGWGGLTALSGFGHQWENHPYQTLVEGDFTRLVFRTSVYNDQWFTFYWGMRAQALYSRTAGWPDERGSTTFDITYYWAGIQSVTDQNGNALNYTLTSGSGNDFRNSFAPAVPEPSSMALMAAGGVLLVVVQRRRRERAGVAATGSAIA
jgi:hypothetical protein